MTARFLVVCEAPADFRIASELADRVLCEELEWLDAELLSSVRVWWEYEPGRLFLAWIDLDKVAGARGYRLRPRSRFSGEPGAADAAAADKALQLAALLGQRERLDAVVLLRDSDGQGERRRGLDQARTGDPGHSWPPFAVIVGLAHPKREAWVLAGFDPLEKKEAENLARLSQELGRDPRLCSHEISARSPGSKRDIKRVLAELTDGDFFREEPCWREAPLALLHQRGQENGLSRYLAEVERILVPLMVV